MKSSKILIVEDETVIATDLALRIQAMGYTVCATTVSGAEAIRLVELHRPDLVLMDIVLKGSMDGIEAAERIRGDFGTAIVFITSYADEERLQRAKLILPFGYIIKPFHERELKATIEIALYIAQVDNERKSIEKMLRLSQFSLDKASICIYWITPNGNFYYVNEASCQKLEYTKEELLTMNQADIDPDAPRDRTAYWNNFKTRRGATTETKHLTSKGRNIPVEVTSYYLEYDGQEYEVAFAMDITKRKKAEEEKAILESQIRQAHKMEAIGTLAGGIAHDFNNILAAVIGYTELAKLDLPLSSPIQRNLELVLKGASRAKELVRQILTFSRLAEQERKPLEVAPIIKEGIKFLRASIPTTIEIKHSIDSATGFILADPTQIHQVLMNLCANAAYAMRDNGGVLEIGLRKIVLDAHTATLFPDLGPGQYQSLTVRDTGCGLEPGTLERIFEPFFTTKDTGEGTGMGLAVVHGIVKSHGGSIKVYSEPQKGTTFQVMFPIIEIEDKKEDRLPDAYPMGKETILFIDDEELLVNLGKSMMERLGYKVISSTNPREALNTFRSSPQYFDLVITDMTMPMLTGDRLAREIMLVRPDIPVILLTGYNETISKDKAEELGISEFTLKPLALSDLAMTIRKVLDRE